MCFSIILATQLPSSFVEQLLLGWFRICVPCNGIFLNKKQMKPSEKSITSAVCLKVAVGNVKYILNIDVLVNWKQNNIRVVRKIFWRSMFQYLKAAVGTCSEKKYSWKRLQHRCFLANLAKFLRTPFFRNTLFFYKDNFIRTRALEQAKNNPRLTFSKN